MAKSLVIEEESGTCTGTPHPHNGYYAGDFTNVSCLTRPSVLQAPARSRMDRS